MKLYKELDIWKKSIELVKHINKLTKLFPKEEEIEIVSQSRIAAISIPTNIAKGIRLNLDNENEKYFYRALESLIELDTQLIISKELNYIEDEQYTQIVALINDLQSEIEKQLKSLNSKIIKENNYKKIIYWIPATLWMILIFYLSSQPASESGALSLKIARIINSIFNNLSIDYTISELHFYIRKAAHFSIYFILSLLLSFAFYKNKSKWIILKSIFICLFFALFDEYNQLFVDGRYGSGKDIIIDFTGAVLGAILINLYYWFSNKKYS